MRAIDYFKRFTYTPNDFYDYLKDTEDAISGNLVSVILPAMKGAGGDEVALEPTVDEANADLVVPVTIKIMDSKKEKVRTFFNGVRQIKVINASTGGTVAINDEDAGVADADVASDLTFVDGVLEFTVTLGGTWVENDTIKITLDDDNVGILGYTIEKNNHFLLDVDANP